MCIRAFVYVAGVQNHREKPSLGQVPLIKKTTKLRCFQSASTAGGQMFMTKFY